MSFSYANPTSGPSAGGIGWFDFGTLSMNPGDVRTGLTGTLNNGNIVTFDLAFSLVPGQPHAFTAVTVPTYTVDPTTPNGVSSVSYSNSVETQVNTAKLVMTKSVDKPLAYIGDILTYQIAVKNTGNVNANNVVLTDILPVLGVVNCQIGAKPC